MISFLGLPKRWIFRVQWVREIKTLIGIEHSSNETSNHLKADSLEEEDLVKVLKKIFILVKLFLLELKLEVFEKIREKVEEDKRGWGWKWEGENWVLYNQVRRRGGEYCAWKGMEGCTLPTTPLAILQVCYCHIFDSSQRILPLSKI